MVCSLPGSSVHGILQVRILEWVIIPFSVDLPNPGIKFSYFALQADSLPSESPEKPQFQNLIKCPVVDISDIYMSTATYFM